MDGGSDRGSDVSMQIFIEIERGSFSWHRILGQPRLHDTEEPPLARLQGPQTRVPGRKSCGARTPTTRPCTARLHHPTQVRQMWESQKVSPGQSPSVAQPVHKPQLNGHTARMPDPCSASPQYGMSSGHVAGTPWRCIPVTASSNCSTPYRSVQLFDAVQEPPKQYGVAEGQSAADAQPPTGGPTPAWPCLSSAPPCAPWVRSGRPSGAA